MIKKFKDYGKSYSIIYDIIAFHRNYIEEVDSLLSFLKPYLREKKILSAGCGTDNYEIILNIIKKMGFSKVETFSALPKLAPLDKEKLNRNRMLAF